MNKRNEGKQVTPLKLHLNLVNQKRAIIAIQCVSHGDNPFATRIIDHECMGSGDMLMSQANYSANGMSDPLRREKEKYGARSWGSRSRNSAPCGP